MFRALCVAFFVIAGFGIGWAGETARANEPITSKRAAELEHLVRQDCGACHGMTLKGGLGPDIRSETLKGQDPEAVAQVILDGVPNTPMPPWRPLMTKAEARWIADYLLKGRAE